MQGALLVREARRRAGLSQVELAAKLGVSRGRVSGWETGRVRVTFGDAERVFEACGLDLEVALRPRDYETRARLAEFARLSPDELVDQLTAWNAARSAAGGPES